MIAAPIQLDSKRFSPLATVALFVVASAAFFWHPLALLLFACLIAVITPTKDFKWLFLVTACVLFTILNVSKQLDDDLVNYLAVQDYASAKPFYTLFNKDELRSISGTYRVTEFGFYAPLWFLGQVIPDSMAAIAIFATLGIYVPTFLGLNLIARSENWSKGMLLMVAQFTFFAGINFLQSTHLIRQYISSAMLFYAFALFLSKRNRWAVLIALYACTVHNGTAPLLPPVAAACWLLRYGESAKWGLGGLFIRIVAMLGVLSLPIAAVPLLQSEFLIQEVPNLKIWHYLFVGAFFIIAHTAIQVGDVRFRSLHYARLAFLTIYVLSLEFFSLGFTLYALRYLAYLEWLYGLMVGAIVFSFFRNRPELQVISRFTVCLAAAAILIARIGASEWMYGPGDNYFLSWDFFQVAQLVSR